MIPVRNEYTNRILTAPLNDIGYQYEYVKDIESLPVWTDDKQCVSEWKLSFRERLSALLFGRLWLSILSGSTQPPISLSMTRDFLTYAKEE